MTSEAEQIKEILNVHLSYINERFDKLETKMDSLGATGCEVGRSNWRAIQTLQDANKGPAQKAGALAGGLIAIIGGTVIMIIEYFRRGGTS